MEEINNGGQNGQVFSFNNKKTVYIGGFLIIVAILASLFFVSKGGSIDFADYPITSGEDKGQLLNEIVNVATSSVSSPKNTGTMSASSEKQVKQTIQQNKTSVVKSLPTIVATTTLNTKQSADYSSSVDSASKSSLLDSMNDQSYPTTSKEDKDRLLGN